MLQNYLADLQFDGKTITKISDGSVVMHNAQREDFDSFVTGILKRKHPEMFVPIYNSRGFKIN